MTSQPTMPASPRKIRIGFVSAFFYRHIISQVTAGILKHLDRQHFEVFAIHVVEKESHETVITPFADRTLRIPPGPMPGIQQAIADLELDILVHSDIGMSPMTYMLAFSRLAPVQCVMAGHPVTSGMPSIDYYLSTALFEPENAAEHYTEKLVLQQTISVHFAKFPRSGITPPNIRGRLGLTTERIYTCPVMLFKFHPDFDAAILAILRADPDSRFVFIEPATDLSIKQAFLHRILQKAPDLAPRIVAIPQMELDQFLGFIDEADAVLDSFYFGAGTTSLFALGIGVPIVTLPSPFMRGRVTYGCYKAIGVMDAVASDFDDYVAKALHIARDKVWRAELQAKILARCDLLFEQEDCVTELGAFFAAAVAAQRAGAPLIDWPQTEAATQPLLA